MTTADLAARLATDAHPRSEWLRALANVPADLDDTLSTDALRGVMREQGMTPTEAAAWLWPGRDG